MNASLVLALPRWSATHFNLPGVPDVSLLRAYTNDVYLVTSRGDRFVLKVYGAGWRHDSEIRFELDVLEHLAARGVLVAHPVVGVSGDALQFLTTRGRQRQAVLFEYADGEKPVPPFSPGMYEREGRAAAALHSAADDFVTTHERRVLDLSTLIDEPLALVRTLDIDESTKQSIVDFGHEIRARISEFASAGLDWGVCHGDLTFDNLLITEGGDFVWYDFDSGGYGWRSIDIQGWAYGRPEWSERWQAFLRGYREVRPLSDNDVAAAPWLAAAQEIWGIRVDLERRIMARGDGAMLSFLVERLDHLAGWRVRLRLHDIGLD